VPERGRRTTYPARVRPAPLLAVAVSALVGAACGVAGGLLIDRSPTYPDPLGVDASLVNQPCQPNKSLLVIGTGSNRSAVAAAVASVSGSDVRYLSTRDSCDTAWTRAGHSPSRYAVYLGPFSPREACEQRMTEGIQGHLVTQLTQGSTAPVQCLCYVSYTQMPVLRPTPSTSTGDMIFIRALQDLLAHMGRIPPDHVTGIYDQDTQTAIEDFQQQHSPPASGVVSSGTWHRLQQVGCPLYPS
jgi:peptidoglycan hydrolase-like protein with peptidoglycan-binding domain